MFCQCRPTNLTKSIRIVKQSNAFSSTSTIKVDLKPSSKSSKPLKLTTPESNATAAAAAMADVLQSMSLFPDDVAEDVGSILNNLKPNTVISPRKLSPAYLLNPYTSRPNFALAYPLGPPTSTKKTHDPFINLGISPLDSPMNPYLTSEFCTSMGKIKSRGQTGLQRSSQRQLGKAVRRARSMGIIPTFGKSLPTFRNGRASYQ